MFSSFRTKKRNKQGIHNNVSLLPPNPLDWISGKVMCVVKDNLLKGYYGRVVWRAALCFQGFEGQIDKLMSLAVVSFQSIIDEN